MNNFLREQISAVMADRAPYDTLCHPGLPLFVTENVAVREGSGGARPPRPPIGRVSAESSPLLFVVDPDVVDGLSGGVVPLCRDGHRLAILRQNVRRGQNDLSRLLADDLVCILIDALPGRCLVVDVPCGGVVSAVEVDDEVTYVRTDPLSRRIDP